MEQYVLIPVNKIDDRVFVSLKQSGSPSYDAGKSIVLLFILFTELSQLLIRHQLGTERDRAKGVSIFQPPFIVIQPSLA